MNMKETTYQSPTVKVIDVCVESIICGSPEITNVANPFNGDVEEEEW